MTATRKPKAANASANSASTPAGPGPNRAPTKADRLISKLKTPDGASIEELSNSFGWLQYSARAALTGLRKKGHAVTRGKQGSVTVYRISE